jgi:hypothetical protein
MNAAMTIEAFHAQLTSSNEDSNLLEALRSLMTVKKEELVSMIETAVSWTGWYL